RTFWGSAHCELRSAKLTTYGTCREVTLARPCGLQLTAEQMSGTPEQVPPGHSLSTLHVPLSLVPPLQVFPKVGVTSQHSLPKVPTHAPPGHSLLFVQLAGALVPPTQRCGEIGGLPAGQPPTEGRSMHIWPPW